MSMWRLIADTIRRWAYKMGLIKGLKSITEYKDAVADEEHYQRIEKWKALYRGYLEEFHKVVYHTVSGHKTRTRKSLKMPKVVSAEMARLVFNEKCRINISDEALSEEIEKVLKRNGFYRRFQNALELNFALGGMAMKVYGDEGGLKVSFVSPDCFVPLRVDGETVTEAAFISQTRKGDRYYTLVESHRWDSNGDYVIQNELFESDSSADLGVKVALSTLYPDLTDEVRIENLERPMFVYLKPNEANNFDPQSPLGISIYANALDTLEAIDIAFDSFMREFRLGKKRILVPASALRTVVDPESGEMHRYFDANDEVYQAFNFMDSDAQKIQDMSVEIRVDEHIKAIQALLDILAMQIGFSAGTFTFDGQGVKTATEVVSENSKTYRTKNSHEVIVEEALKEFIACIVQAAELYGLFTAPEDFEVTIDFDDSIAQDRDSNADYYLKLKNAGLISVKTALMRILDLTEEQAEEEIRRMNEERAIASAEDLFGGDA